MYGATDSDRRRNDLLFYQTNESVLVLIVCSEITVGVIQQRVGHVGHVTFGRAVVLTHHKRFCTPAERTQK